MRAQQLMTFDMTVPAVRIRLLSGFAMWVDDVAVPDSWRLRKGKTLVKLLALAPGHRLHRDVLAETLWPDRTPEASANNVHQALYAARRALAEAGAPASTIELRDDVVALCPAGGLTIDAEEFLAAVAAARDVAELREALAAWTGELLPEDGYAEWAGPARDRLHETRVGVVGRLAGALIACGAAEEAAALLEPLVADRPLDERLHRTLMEAQLAAGRGADALLAYNRLHAALDRELGAEPDQETRDLRQRLAGGPGIDGDESRHNLPAAVTSFVGRRRELVELDAALSRARLVTLTGPGGAGKTRLAIELGRRRAEDRRHPNGVRFVELADLRAGEQVVAAVAAAIGLRLPGGGSGVAAVVDRLHTQRVLVVLDNCEHLVAAAAALTEALLAGCPGVTVLATGREPLRVRGELTWRVPSLQLPPPGRHPDPVGLAQLESVQLFVERAGATRPGFALDATTSEPVALICRRLDGIPLALELAAARLAHLSVAELAARLDNALSLLSYGPPGGLDRQHTLAATIDWSHALLTETERALFRRLSVFAGGFDLDAVERVGAGVGPDPVGTLSRLIDKSLVVAHLGAAGGRYRLLEVIRQYAAARLDAAERAECRRWHRDYYADRAARLDPDRARPVVGEPPRWFADEHDNLRVALAAALADDPEQALRLATSTWRFWMSRGMIEEGTRWLRRALDAHPERSTLRAAALYGLAVLSTRLGQAGPLDGIGAELVAIAADSGDGAQLAAAHHQQTVLAFMAGDWPRTDALQAQTLVEAAGVPTVLTSTLHVAAILALSRGELEDAGRRLADAGAALAAVPESADPFLITMSPAFVVERRAGWTYVIGEETMWLARRVGRAQATAHLLLTRAMHARLAGDLDGSLQLLEAAASAFRSLGDRYGQALTVAQRGHALRWAGDADASRSCFETAEALRCALGDLRGVALALDGQALADAVDGRAERARLLGGRALAGMRRGGDVAGIGFTAWNLATVQVLLGDLPAAAELLEHPAVGPDSPGWQRAIGWNRLLLADIRRRLGDSRHEAAAAAAQEMFTRLGDRAGLAELRGMRAKGTQSEPS